jgi:hypothetical protein
MARTQRSVGVPHGVDKMFDEYYSVSLSFGTRTGRRLARTQAPFDQRLEKAEELLADFGPCGDSKTTPGSAVGRSRGYSIASGRTAARSSL